MHAVHLAKRVYSRDQPRNELLLRVHHLVLAAAVQSGDSHHVEIGVDAVYLDRKDRKLRFVRFGACF